MVDFPNEFDRAIQVVAKRYNLLLWKNSHHNAINRELMWFEGKIRKRLNFELGSSLSDFDITFYQDDFPFFPRLIIFLNNYLSISIKYKTHWEDFDAFALDKNEDFYVETISFMVNRMKNNIADLKR